MKMKRFLSLLLAAVMVMSFIPPVHVHAAECSWYSDGHHLSSYSNNNGTHKVRCVCGYSEDVKCTFGKYTNNYSNHYRQCSVCKGYEYSDHTVTKWTVTSGWSGNQHKGTCKDCGASVSGSCSYSGGYITENGQHWQLCSVCKQPGKKTDCSGNMKSNGDGTHSITCSTCTVAATTDCTYGDYQSNGPSGHRKQCSTCRTYSATEPHKSFKYEAGSNGRHKKICADCGYNLGNEDCSFGSYSDLGTQHSRTCSVCKNTLKENHSYDYTTKKCVCGAEKHDHSWKLTASGNKITASCVGTTGTCEYNKDGGSLTITASNVDYDGSAKKATVTNTLSTGSYNDSRYTVSYYKKNATGNYVSIYDAPTDAGEYRATVYSTLDSSAVASVEYKINKVTKKVTATGYTGTYNGEKHGITVNAPAGLTVEYSEDGKYYSSYNIPTYTDAGTYTVYYKVTGNENYEIIGGTGSAVVQINPVELSVTVEGYTGDYDGHKHGITVSAPEGVTVTYSDKENGYYSSSAPTYTDAGTYTVYYKVTGDKNHTINGEVGSLTGSAVVQINPVELSVTAEGYTGTYDGHKHGITVNAPEGVTVTYSDKENGYYSSSAPTYTDAGTYTVYYKVTGDKNHTINGEVGSLTGSADVQINPVKLTVTAEGYTGTYDGNAHGITVDAGDLKVTYDGYKSTSPTYTDAGTYTVKYEVENNRNYEITGRTGSAVVQINPVKLTVTAEGYTGTYDGNAHGITVDAGDLKVTYDGYKSTSPTYTDAGTYTVKYEVENNRNYEITGRTGSAVVQINPVKLTVTAADKTVDYDGEAHGITVTGLEGTNLKVYYGESASWCNSASYTKTNAGVYEIFYKVVAGDYPYNKLDNYEITNATGSAMLTINQANLEDVVKVTPYSGTYDGKAHGITVTAPSDADVYYSADGETWTSWPNQNITYTDVGTYTVHYKVVSKSGNYVSGVAKAKAAAAEVTGQSTVTITALDLAQYVTAENTEFTYNRNSWTNTDYKTVQHSIKVTVDDSKIPDYVTVEYSTDGENWSTSNPSFTDAGVYTVQYRVYVKGSYDYSAGGYAENKNYVKATGTKTVTINKAELPITGLVGYHGPYDGSTHYGFGYKYSTSYGDYFTLYWYNYLHDELNYNFSWTDESGAARTLTVKAGEEPKLTDFPGFTKQNVESVDTDKDTEPGYGAHKVTVTIGSDNYNDKTFNYYVQIGPGGAIAKDRTYPYDGTEHYIANYIAGQLYYWGYGEVYNFGSIKIEYRVNKDDPTYDGNDDWLPASQEPGQTNVGSKLVDWRVTMDSDQNGKFGEEENSFGSREVFIGTNRVTVTAIGLTATADDKTITYGDAYSSAPADNGITITGSFVSPDTEAVVNKSELSYSSNYEQFMDVGEYTITPAGLSATNYTFTYVPGKLTVEPKPVTILIDEDKNITVDENDLVNGDTCEIDTITYYKDGQEVTDITAPGTYTAVVTLKNGNYVSENNVEFTVENPVTYYKVEFNMQLHGEQVPEQNITAGGKATKPTDPTAAGYTFGGWYTDEKCTTAYDFNAAVTGNMTLYAKWTETSGSEDPIPAKFKVTFDVRGHGTAPADQTVEQGAKAEKPADPIAANYTFGGWYTDKDCTIAYVFDTEVENNITLYAKWTKTIYKVTYDANGGTGEMPVVNVEAGEGHTLVANEFKAPTGKTFKCWKVGLKEYKAGEKIDVTENVTVKAVWKNKTASSDLDYVPAAGDNFPTFLWAGLLLFSVVALVEVVVLRRKRS